MRTCRFLHPRIKLLEHHIIADREFHTLPLVCVRRLFVKETEVIEGDLYDPS